MDMMYVRNAQGSMEETGARLEASVKAHQFGVIGVIIGPIVAALFVTVWDIYGTVFKDILPRVGSAADAILENGDTAESTPNPESDPEAEQ